MWKRARFPSQRRLPCAAATVLLLSGALAQAQVPSDSLERRFRFAELFTGVDLTAVPAGRVEGAPLALSARAYPRFTIGGLHFWGFADFAVTIPLGTARRREEVEASQLTTGIETRGRWYPRPMRTDGLSPFVGVGLGAVDLQLGEGPRVYRMQPMTQAGVVWRRGRTLVDLGWAVRPSLAVHYPSSRASSATVRPAATTFFAGIHLLAETTAGLAQPIRDGAWGRREQKLRSAGRLSGPTLALGISSPILTGSTAYNRTARPFLAERPRGAPMLDVGVGWHLEGARTQLNVAWRRAEFETSAFAFTQKNERQSLAVEAFTFLGDWHGFVPYVGPVLSLERLAVTEVDAGVRLNAVTRDMLAPGVIVGWDIRPTRSQPWVLRTNLRWFPALRVPLAAGVQALDQLEFNFIQLVWYPRRS